MDVASTLGQVPAISVYAIVVGLGLTEGAFGGIVGVVTYVPTMLLAGYASVEGAEQLAEWAVTYGPAAFVVALTGLLAVLATRSRVTLASARVA